MESASVETTFTYPKPDSDEPPKSKVSVGTGAVCVRLFCCVSAWCLLVSLTHSAILGAHYTGRVLYRGSKAPVAGVLVEVVEAKDNGEPKDDVLASTRADDKGRFTVVLSAPTDEPVALVVAAQRTSAETGGDRRQEGFEIKTKRTVLGFLPRPSPVKPNTVLIERRKPRNSSDEN